MKKIKEWIEASGDTWYDPLAAFGQVCMDRTAIKTAVEINRFVISQCDALVAYVRKDLYQFGTIREIEIARGMGRPVTVITDDYYGGKSLEDCSKMTLDDL